MSREPTDVEQEDQVAPKAPDSLLSMQSLVRALVTAPAGLAPSLAGQPGVPGWLDAWPDPRGALEKCTRGDARLDRSSRLDVYAQAYFLRLYEVLLEDHPCVAWICGEAVFNDLVTAFLVAHPSTSPNLRQLGRPFAAFLAEHPVAAFARDRWPSLACVARLEWAFADVFDAADDSRLERSGLAAIEPEHWAEIPLSPVAAFVRLGFTRRVGAFVSARRAEEEVPPDLEGAETLIVWREAERAVFRRVEPLEAEALGRVEAGTTFGDLCAWAAERVGEAEAPALAAGWLADWLAAGWLKQPPGLSRLSSAPL